MFKEINSMTKQFQPQLRVVKAKHGTILTGNEEMKSRWKEYCEDMYKCSEGTEEELEVELTEDLKSRELMRKEVELAIKDLNIGKSPGCDLVTDEMIKASGEQGIDVYNHTIHVRKFGIKENGHRNGKDQSLYQCLKMRFKRVY